MVENVLGFLLHQSLVTGQSFKITGSTRSEIKSKPCYFIESPLAVYGTAISWPLVVSFRDTANYDTRARAETVLQNIF